MVRYEAANLLALNFVLYDVLAGGASRSLRSDTQGKTLALALLRMPLALLEDLFTSFCERHDVAEAHGNGCGGHR